MTWKGLIRHKTKQKNKQKTKKQNKKINQSSAGLPKKYWNIKKMCNFFLSN